MMFGLIILTYIFGAVTILLVGMVFGDNGLGLNYYRGLLLMGMVWPYVVYRGVRY